MFAPAFLAGVDAKALQLVGGGASPVGESQSLTLERGHVYELRSSALVHVRAGGSDARESDLLVRPDTPLLFVADVDAISLCAGSADAFVWLRQEMRGEKK